MKNNAPLQAEIIPLRENPPLSSSLRRMVSRQTLRCSTTSSSALARSAKVHRVQPSGGSEQARATSCTSSLPLSFRAARGSSLRATWLQCRRQPPLLCGGQILKPDIPNGKSRFQRYVLALRKTDIATHTI